MLVQAMTTCCEMKKSLECARTLLANGSPADVTYLETALASGNLEVSHLLLDEGADPLKMGPRILSELIEADSSAKCLPLVTRLIDMTIWDEGSGVVEFRFDIPGESIRSYMNVSRVQMLFEQRLRKEQTHLRKGFVTNVLFLLRVLK